MDPAVDAGLRLWRARKRHDCIDAVLHDAGPECILQFFRNRRLILERRHDSAELARAEADARLRELQRAGWTSHW